MTKHCVFRKEAVPSSRENQRRKVNVMSVLVSVSFDILRPLSQCFLVPAEPVHRIGAFNLFTEDLESLQGDSANPNLTDAVSAKNFPPELICTVD
jgi:hypothetical protein